MEKFENILSSPSVLNIILDSRYKYYLKGINNYHFQRGILFTQLINNTVLDDLKAINISEKDVIILTYPKSGTTWLSELISLLLSNCEPDKIANTDVSERVMRLEGSHIDRLNERNGDFNIFHSHLPYNMLPDNFSRAKIIYLVRNPKDVAVSYYHHHRMAKHLGNFDKSFTEFLSLFMEEKVCMGSWFDHVQSYWNHKTNINSLFLRFEDMKKDLPHVIRELSQFLDLNVTEDQIELVATHCSFENMKINGNVNRDTVPLFDKSKSTFMRKGKIGDWKHYFTPTESDLFDLLYQYKMKNIDLDDMIYE